MLSPVGPPVASLTRLWESPVGHSTVTSPSDLYTMNNEAVGGPTCKTCQSAAFVLKN